MTSEDELKLARIFINTRGQTADLGREDATYHYVKKFIEEQREDAISLANMRAKEIVKIILKDKPDIQKQICDSISREVK